MRKLIFVFTIVTLNFLSFGIVHAWHVEGCAICSDQEPITGALVTVEIDGSIYSSVSTNAEGCYSVRSS